VGSDEGYTLGELVERLGGDLSPLASSSKRVYRFAAIEMATPRDLCFVASPRYRSKLTGCEAAAIVLRAGDVAHAPTDLTTIVVADPYVWYARAAVLFCPPPKSDGGIHPQANVADDAMISAGVTIEAGAVIGPRTRLGQGVWIGAGCVVGEDVVIGEQSRLYPRVTIYPGCLIGSRVSIHAGAVIGSDGFGFARDGGVWIKIPQTGRVRIGDDCEIGANTTIDRGAIEDTVIGAGCKLDNQIQVAHNVRIGEGCAIAACVGIAGSAIIGNHCQIGGGAGILGHLEIIDHTVISAMSLVTRSITTSGFYTGVFPLMRNRDWEHAAAGLRRQVRLRGQSRLILGANTSPGPSSSPSPSPRADSGLGADSDHEATRYER